MYNGESSMKMSGTTAPAISKVEAPVIQQLDFLGKDIEALSNQMAKLRARMEPILGGPMPPQPQGSSAPHPFGPLASTLANYRERIDALAMTVEEIHRRLEI